MSSGVPPEIPGLGSTAVVLRVTPGFDPLKAGVGPDEYFVLSRVDGKQTLREILLSTGLPVERGIAIVLKLRSIGAVLMPGETAPKPQPTVSRTVTPPLAPQHRPPANLRPPPPPPDVPTQRLPPNILNPHVDAPTMRRSGVSTPAKGVPVPVPVVVIDPLPDPTPAEQQLLAEQNDIPLPERKKILSLLRLKDTRDHHLLLGVARGADAKTLKRTYFKLSKEIHPDRYYGRQLGSFKDKLSPVFEAVSRAYEKLTSPEAARNSGVFPTVQSAEQPQTPQEYAAELFDRACELEVGGDALEAMKLFSAAVRVESQPRYLRRAAICAITAGQPKSAVEYAKKAQSAQPNDPSAARLLAAAFRAAGKLGDAEEVLVMAMAMRSRNDVLTSELQHDLADIRRLLAASE